MPSAKADTSAAQSGGHRNKARQKKRPRKPLFSCGAPAATSPVVRSVPNAAVQAEMREPAASSEPAASYLDAPAPQPEPEPEPGSPEVPSYPAGLENDFAEAAADGQAAAQDESDHDLESEHESDIALQPASPESPPAATAATATRDPSPSGGSSPRKTVVSVHEAIRWELGFEEGEAPTVLDTLTAARAQLGLAVEADDRSPVRQQLAEVCSHLQIETGWEAEAPSGAAAGGGTVDPEAAAATAAYAPTHEEVQMLVMVTGLPESQCRDALAAAGGDMRTASVSLLAPPEPAAAAATARPPQPQPEPEPREPALTLEQESLGSFARSSSRPRSRSGSRSPVDEEQVDLRPKSPRSPRAALSEVINRLCEGLGSKAEARSAFRRMDKDSSGCLDARELTVALRTLKLHLNARQVAVVVQHLDTDGAGVVSIDAFVQLVWERKLQRLRQSLRGLSTAYGGPQGCEALFNQYDREHNGCLRFEEFLQVIRKDQSSAGMYYNGSSGRRGLTNQEAVSDSELREMFDHVGQLQTGTIQLSEFLTLVATPRAVSEGWERHHSNPGRVLTRILREAAKQHSVSNALSMFHRFDADQSGGLTRQEFYHAMISLNPPVRFFN